MGLNFDSKPFQDDSIKIFLTIPFKFFKSNRKFFSESITFRGTMGSKEVSDGTVERVLTFREAALKDSNLPRTDPSWEKEDEKKFSPSSFSVETSRIVGASCDSSTLHAIASGGGLMSFMSTTLCLFFDFDDISRTEFFLKNKDPKKINFVSNICNSRDPLTGRLIERECLRNTIAPSLLSR